MKSVMTSQDKPIDPDKPRRVKPPLSDEDRAKRQNDLLDHGLEETFPASDPVSIVDVE